MKSLLIAFVAAAAGFCFGLLLMQFSREKAPSADRADREYVSKSASQDKDSTSASPPRATPARSAGGKMLAKPVSPWLFVGDTFEGTFLQLTNEHRTWLEGRWRSEFEKLRHIGIKIVIVQWSEYDAADFTVAEGGKSPMEEIAAAADMQGMDLYVGLSLRKSWGLATSFTDSYMAEELERNVHLADKLYTVLRSHPSFRGWYIPHEVSDRDDAGDHQAMICEFFHNLTRHLNELDKLKPVLASGFTNPANANLVHFVWYWTLFLNEAGIDILLFQDGAGIGKESKWRDNLPFIEAMASLGKEFPTEIWLVAETFTQTHGRPVDDQPFAAKPADLARVRQQIEALSKYKKRLIAFSYFDYMRPSAGNEAAQLYDGYRKFTEEVIARNSKESSTSPRAASSENQ